MLRVMLRMIYNILLFYVCVYIYRHACMFDRNILVSNIQPVLQYSEFAAEIKDLCKFSDCQPFTVKWLDEEGENEFIYDMH